MGRPLVLVVRMAPGRRCCCDLVEQGALDVEVLGDGFDDPVAVGDEGEVVVEVAEGDEAGGVGGEEGRGLGFLQAVEGGEDEFVALGLWRVGGGAGRDDVEQDYGQAGVGDVRGDARAHGSGSEDGDLANLTGLERAGGAALLEGMQRTPAGDNPERGEDTEWSFSWSSCEYG